MESDQNVDGGSSDSEEDENDFDALAKEIAKKQKTKKQSLGDDDEDEDEDEIDEDEDDLEAALDAAEMGDVPPSSHIHFASTSAQRSLIFICINFVSIPLMKISSRASS